MTGLDLSSSGLSGEFSLLVEAHLGSAARALDLATDFRSVEVCADDLSGQDGGWFQFHPAGGDDSRARVTVFCSAEVFCRSPYGNAGLHPGIEIWEQLPVRDREPGSDPGEFHGPAADRFLLHNLLLARDLVREKDVLSDIPDSLARAFAEAWNVTVDGRLARLGLAGYDLTYRRGRFSGVFSSVGVLLPSHWEIFQSLWDGALSVPAEVLAASRRLPRL